MLDVAFNKDYNIYGSNTSYKSFEDLKERQAVLYDTIRYLNCNDCNLNKLPKLPRSLEVLVCNNNNLTELPILPYGLKELYCIRNKLTKLPDLPDQLTALWCQFNKLKSLPELPDTLYTLVCDCNKLTEFPVVPIGVQTLHCSYNNIKVLPYIPKFVRLYEEGGMKFNDNPFCDFIVKRYDGNMNKYMKEKKAIDTISDWFMNCKYNPRFKYCRKRLQTEFSELYN